MKKRSIAAAKKAAKKAVKKATKTTATKAVATKATAKKATTKVAAKKVAAKKAVKKTAAKKAAPKKTTASPAASKTAIVAKIDIGFGNTLFLRGDAPGLSWSQGVPMDCSGDSWTISMAGVTEPFEFKVLINDSFWSAGYNHSAEPGGTTTVFPQF
ncbi:hypothetical protein [Pelagicoccus sp. SDUM812003]|uniref:hypothetical protein n=1 Tax=Pelagicoccus sp. SDUM812003 TaxID=3041267 RepID=UPI00280E1049|nr:hypothetical protein [Pelagicoccus sp. SDUM812003]MDQ8204906.1 hypothetical protein [Pelagicoccus sp. SDUM812003]